MAPYVVTKKGTRQGCRIACIMFNMAYASALIVVRALLRDAGFVLSLKVSGNVEHAVVSMVNVSYMKVFS